MSRTDFEAAYIERYGHRPRGWNDDFQVYQDAHANGAWFGWQARAAGIEAKVAPVAYITGQFAGRCIIEPINRAAVLPTGMALYSRPQPSAGVVMPERKDEQGAPTVNLHIFREGWNACLDEFARLNGKEVE